MLTTNEGEYTDCYTQLPSQQSILPECCSSKSCVFGGSQHTTDVHDDSYKKPSGQLLDLKTYLLNKKKQLPLQENIPHHQGFTNIHEMDAINTQAQNNNMWFTQSGIACGD